jgi:superfamily II DNA/RNA helicase
MVRPLVPGSNARRETSSAPVRFIATTSHSLAAPRRMVPLSMSFAQLGLSEKVLQAVVASGYTEPTPIQAQAIPHILARRDVLGIAQTGTGKTAAFTLPMLTLLETGRARARMPRTLILEPTRELAAQVEESFERYGINHRLSVALLIGGVSFGDQDLKITRGVDVLIATPGRLLDHFERGKLLLTGVELLVIDEADRMLDMGFIPDIERIVKLVPFTRQTLFFSATMPPEITRLADAFLHNPVRVEASRPATVVTTITQRLTPAGREPHEKRESLRALIRNEADLKNAIIFCNRKRDVAIVHKSLQRHGFNVAALHGDMDQRARMAALESFRTGEVKLLVASDVAARGLDIPAVSHVLNYDVPHHAEDYVHRIGRTGRAGRTGQAVTLVAPGDERSLAAIERLIGQAIPWDGAPPAERPPRERSERPGRERPDRQHGGGRRRGRQPGRSRKPAPAAPAAAPSPAPSPPREPRPAPKPAERPAAAESDAPAAFGGHVPAFLMRSPFGKASR